MNFPMTIADQQELNRLIDQISEAVANKTAEAMMMKFGKLSATMTTADCYRESGSRTAVDQATKSGKLKFTYKNSKRIYKRSDFNAWNKLNIF